MKMSREKLVKIKEYTIFILLLLWVIMPVLQTIKAVHEIIDLKESYFNLMKIIGGVGIGLSIFTIYDKIKRVEDKKQVIKKLMPIIIFILFMIWTFISSMFSPNKRLAFNGTYYRKEGYYMYINYAGFFLSAFLLDSEKLRKILLKVFVGVSVFLIILSRMCLSGTRFTNVFVNTNIDTTVFAQFNHYGYYIMMSLMGCLGLFITEKNKILKIIYAIIFSLIGYALIYNDTFGCFLATTVVLIACGIYALIKKQNRKTIFTAIAIFVLLSCFTTKGGINLAYKNISTFVFDVRSIIAKIINLDIEDEDIEENFEKAGTSRMALWTNGIKFIIERPILGYGPENLRTKYFGVGIDQDRPHNLIIQLATTSGIPGMLLYVTAVGIIVIIAIKDYLKGKKENIVFLLLTVTYLISAMFGNSMFYTSPYFFIFLGSLMHCNLTQTEE